MECFGNKLTSSTTRGRLRESVIHRSELIKFTKNTNESSCPPKFLQTARHSRTHLVFLVRGMAFKKYRAIRSSLLPQRKTTNINPGPTYVAINSRFPRDIAHRIYTRKPNRAANTLPRLLDTRAYALLPSRMLPSSSVEILVFLTSIFIRTI